MAQAVEQAAAAARVGKKRAAALRAWFESFRARPAEYDLGFYHYGGAKPDGVGRDLNRELNVRLKRVYAAAADALEAPMVWSTHPKSMRWRSLGPPGCSVCC